MFLSIYVYRQLGLTLDLTEDRPVLPQERIREGPAFRRLTAEPDRLRDPVRLRHWLTGFLPENGAIGPYREHARRQWEAHGVGSARDSAASILWGNADAEYTGAIDFRQTTGTPVEDLPARGPAITEPISDREIGGRLDLATRIAEGAPGTRPDELLDLTGRLSSLSGMRGKLGLTRHAGGRWAIARGDSLNTWIAKHEHREGLPGEAGLEAICQRALELVRIPAATTEARVFDGKQAVLSKRSDRVTEADGRVHARHQEEWIQAACHPPDDKYDNGLGNGPQWPDAYRLLRERGKQPDTGTAFLTRVLAAAWMLGNGDLHRRNLGFLHAPGSEAPAIGLAPLYDASSAAGTRYHRGLAVGMEGVTQPERITPARWVRHSAACGVPADITLAALEDLFRTLPDALATARARARDVDEYVSRAAMDRRVEATVRHVEARERGYRQLQKGASHRQVESREAGTGHMAETLRRAIDAAPGGTVSQQVQPTGDALELVYIPPGENPQAIGIGTARSPRQAAAVMASAGAARPEDIPELERTIDNERARARTRSLTRG